MPRPNVLDLTADHNPQRHVTVVPQQALFLFNSPFVADRCRQLVRRLRPETLDPTSSAAGIRKLYRIVIQRLPSDSELAESQQFLTEFQPATTGKLEAPLTAWEQLSQVLLFTNDFLFVD